MLFFIIHRYLPCLFQVMPRVAQRGRQEPYVVRFLNRVVEVERVRVRGRDDCEQNHVAIHIVSKHTIYMAGARDYNPPPPFFSSPRPFNHQIQESAAAKAYDAEWKWMNSSEAKQRYAAAKAQALSDFKKRFPHAQMSRFQVQVEFDANRKALGRVLFPDGDGSWEKPAHRRPKVLVPRAQSRFGGATRWWFSLSAVTTTTKTNHHLSQSQQSPSQTTQGKASRIFLTSR